MSEAVVHLRRILTIQGAAVRHFFRSDAIEWSEDGEEDDPG